MPDSSGRSATAHSHSRLISGRMLNRIRNRIRCNVSAGHCPVACAAVRIRSAKKLPSFSCEMCFIYRDWKLPTLAAQSADIHFSLKKTDGERKNERNSETRREKTHKHQTRTGMKQLNDLFWVIHGRLYEGSFSMKLSFGLFAQLRIYRSMLSESNALIYYRIQCDRCCANVE